MAGWEPTWQDFLQREVQESQSSEESKSETLELLEQAAQICDKFGNSEKAAEIRKDCEDVRITTIAALKGVLWETSWRLADMRYELDGPWIETLSDGQIDKNELVQIREEFDEVKDYNDSYTQERNRLLQSFTWATLKIDTNNSAHVDYILEDLPNRIKMLSNSSDILFFLNHEKAQWESINMSDLPTSSLEDPQILLYLVNNTTTREWDYNILPSKVFQNTELCSILWSDVHHWDMLFFKITEIHGVENSVSFFSQLKTQYNEIFWNDLTTFARSIPQRVKDVDQFKNRMWIPDSERPEIDSAEKFIQWISFYLEERDRHIETSLISNNGMIETALPSWVETWNIDEFSIPNHENILNNLNEYIRNFWISSEIENGIHQLLEEWQIGSVRYILPNLLPDNDFQRSIATKSIENEVYFTSLNQDMKSHPDILKVMWSHGSLKTQSSDISVYINNQKQLAAFLEWYIWWGYKIDDIIYSQEMAVIQSKLIDNPNEWNLTQNEEIALSQLSESLRVWEEQIWNLEAFWEIHWENLAAIRSIIISHLGEWEEINFTLLEELMQNGDNDNYYRLLRNTLREKRPDITSAEVQQILLSISQEVVKIRERERDRSREETSRKLREMDTPFESPYITESWEINYILLVWNFQKYWRENLDIENIGDLDTREFIESFLNNQDFSEWMLDAIKEELVEDLQKELALIQAQIIAQKISSSTPEELDQFIEDWIWTTIKKDLYEWIISWEIDLQKPIELNDDWIIVNIVNPKEGIKTWNYINIENRLQENKSWFTLTTPDKKKIQLSAEEANMLKNKPSIENNIIEAHNYFIETINMPSAWKYREPITRAMNVIWGESKINLYDNSLSKIELLKVSKYLHEVIYWKNDSSSISDSDHFEKSLETYSNWWSEIVTKKSYWARQLDRFEQDLWKVWVIDDSVTGFNIDELRKLHKSWWIINQLQLS